MNLEQMKARLAEIMNKLTEFSAVEDYSDADIDVINALNEEFEGLKKNIEAKEKVAAMTASANASTRRTSPEAPRAEVMATRKEKNGGFTSYGDFLHAVKKSSTSGEVDKRFTNTMSEGVNADGGFAVPEDFGSEINTALLQSDESLFAKTKQLKVSGNNLTIPKSESQPWSGGIQAYWTNEAAAITDSKGVISQASFKLNKLAALVKITDELLEDGLALESYIKTMAPLAIMHKVNEAIISGDGTGKPAGILGSTFGVSVAKEVGQAADTIVARNVIKMFSKMIPSARKGAVWYINAMCEEQLRTMKDDNGNFIYLAAGSQLNQSPYALLMGLPVVPLMGGLPALGEVGDIVLVNLDYYYTIAKGGVKSAVSSHLFFDRDIQAFKFTLRLDGKCPFVSPVTTQYGSHTMSAIVTLAERA